MENENSVIQTEQSLINLDDIMPSIERRAVAHQRFIQIMDKLVNPETDIDNFQGTIRRNINYAKKVFRVIGGRFEYMKDEHGRPLCNRIDYTDDKGKYYVYETYGRYILPNGEVIEQSGMFSSRDKFFGRADGQFKLTEDVDERSVRQASQTECFKKCIFIALGLGDVDEAEMKRYGVKVADAPKQEYGKGTKGGSTDTPDDKKRRDDIKSMCNELFHEGFQRADDQKVTCPEDILQYLTECDYNEKKDGKPTGNKKHFDGWDNFDKITSRALKNVFDIIRSNHDEYLKK